MKLKTTSLAALAAFTLAGPASAAVLVNAGFETDAVAADSDIFMTPTSWTGYGDGQKYVADGTAFTGISGGHSSDQYFLAYAVSGIPVSQIRQDSNLNWSAVNVGDSLTMSMYTNFRSDVAAAPLTYFWLNDTDAADDLGLNSPALTMGTQGTWTLQSWTYVVTQEIKDLSTSQSWGAVEVGLGIVNFSSTNQQVAFDSISLTHIPEPSAALLGGLGLLALLRRRRA